MAATGRACVYRGDERAFDIVRSLPLLEKEERALREMVSHRVPLRQVPEAFDALMGRYHLDGRDAIKIAVDPWLE